MAANMEQRSCGVAHGSCWLSPSRPVAGLRMEVKIEAEKGGARGKKTTKEMRFQ
jgi:hypothetical protein